jgi:RimJ/RimL family protein N-acetyltransferase
MGLMIRVRTPRLELVASTLQSAEVEMNDPAELEILLDAHLAAPWPPPLNDEHSMSFNLKSLKENPDAHGFAMWYFINTENGARRIIGNGGCKGKPQDGVVEIGYSLFPEFQGRGYATEAVGGLLSWIFDQHPNVTTVIGETLPELIGSIRVLEKNGFALVGDGSEPGVIRFTLPRSTWQARLSG